MNTDSIDSVTVTRSTCPLCNRELITKWHPNNIPFFGEIMNITSQCDCGFRYSDTLILSQRDPVRYELKVRSEDDINARVVRSTSGTIRIPELGVDIEPGPASEAFVSNIEGVLDRVKDILGTIVRWNEEGKTERALELLDTIDKIMEGEYEVTVVIEDPMGNSAIISDNATSRGITDDEAALLKTGMIIFEK